MKGDKIIWLASYLKSGNTWFRAFLTALENDGEFDINSLNYNEIFSGRDAFYQETDIDSRYLYDREIKNLMPDVYRKRVEHIQKPLIVKIHDAFTCNDKGCTLIPEDATLCVVYFIRNPLDIAGSLANHGGFSVERAVQIINDPGYCFARQTNNLNINKQFRQFASDWSSHVTGWTTKPRFPVMVVRYEDMLCDTFRIFKEILRFIGFTRYTDQEIERAVNECRFDKLKKQERENGFNERFQNSSSFFRKGSSSNWKTELSPELINSIIFHHSKVMEYYHYTGIEA